MKETIAMRIPKVLVLHGDQVITGRGLVLPAPAGGPAPEVLSRLAGALGDNGQVLISDRPGWDHLAEPGQSGLWTVTGGPGWHTARLDSTRLRIGKIPLIKAGNSPLLDSADDLFSIAGRHQMFADAVGVPFYGDGGTVALTLLEETTRIRGREVLRKWNDAAAPIVREDAWPGGSMWIPDGQPYRAALTIDRNAQYLAGANAVYLPLDAPARTGRIDWDPRRSGYWLIRVPANPVPQLPHPCGARAEPGEERWVTHPTAALLAQLGAAPVVLDSWTLPRERCRRIMDPWYARLKDARAEFCGMDDPDSIALYEAVKDTYSRGISHLGKEGRRWYRPDWRAILFASARMRMWWALYQTGITSGYWPSSIGTDSVTYADLAAGKALAIGSGIGQWKLAA
jgi:hypothetical protein